MQMPDRACPAPRIVTGIDGSPSSGAALRWAVSQATLTGAVVEAVTAWEFPAAVAGYGWAAPVALEAGQYEEFAEKLVTEVISDAVDPASSVQVITRVREGNAAQVLLDASVGADLLVVGSRGHGTFAGALLGSVSTHCAHHATCPVVVIRGSNPAS
jgi:nucleotide-binding universal stress UspA family protein